jgi:hypothetical protein
VNRRVALLLGALVACGRRDGDDARVLREFTDFRDKACACKDPACAEKVQEDFQRWAEEQAKNASNAPRNTYPEMAKQMAEAATQFQECITKAKGDAPPADKPATVPPPPAEKVFDAERIIRLAFEQRGTYVVDHLELAYVDARGQLDAKYGRAEIGYGREKPPDPADDPKRPIGAPVEAAPIDTTIMSAECPKLTWVGGQRTQEVKICLAMTAFARPRCSVPQLWKQAIAIDAPPQALASLQLVASEGKAQYWVFEIEDAPRGIHIRHELADTCQPIVEKP